MTKTRTLFLYIFCLGVLTASASAQVRFDVYSNPYSGPGINVSVGNSGNCQPVYNRSGYYNYPVVYQQPVRPRARRGYRVVNPRRGYYQQRNNGYYVAQPVVNPGYGQGYYNQGYYNQGNYNQGYYSQGGRCR